MAAPVVQTLPELMAELAQGAAPQQQVIEQRRAGLGAKYAGQVAGIEAKKGQGFDVISDQARGRGGSFSGVPIDEQARYLSTEYLPGLQNLQYQQNEEEFGLNEQSAKIQADIFGNAVGRRDKQVSDLNSWNQMEYQTAAQAREAQLNRDFEAGQAAMSRSAAQAEKGPSNSEIIGSLNAWALQRVGRNDGKLSPSNFKAGYQKAAEMGMDVDTYIAVMQRYVNGSHAKDYDL